MKTPPLAFALLMMVPLAAPVASAAAGAARANRELVVCGRDEVFILDLDARDAAGAPKKIWSWQAAGRRDLPAEYHGLFRSTDECKPFDGGRRILITSSGGAVALVDREKDSVLFYGRAVNAHSADLLPNGRVAVAASRDPQGTKGDALILFEIASPGRELWRTELPTGHGVVWDESRKILWALADREIRRYQLVDWETTAPRLRLVGGLQLPEGSGHDLYPVPHTSFLSVTTAAHCWLFDRDVNALVPHPALSARSSIKCISQHPITGQLAFVEAERPNWWSLRIQFLHPDQSCSVPDEQFYKVRWVVVPAAGGR
ncbi:MAG: DUF6528 family protein [Opitutaceae bacterium]|nr:DUF6528 family protein [Opitutaceae bacterium]